MFCWIFKWKISQSHDRQIPLRGLTARHVSRCGQCRDFDRSLHGLTHRLKRSVPGLLQEPSHDLAEKVITSLAQKPRETGVCGPRKRPLLATAATLVILVAGLLVLSRLVPMKKSPPDPLFPLKSTASISAPAAMKGILTGMASPFHQELRRLKRHLLSATRSLADGFKLNT